MKHNLLIGLCFLIACNTRKIDIKSEEQKLIKMTKDWSDSLKLFSVDKNLSYYTDDAVMMAPGESAIKGKEAMRSGFEETAKNTDITLSWAPINVSISENGDMAYMTEDSNVAFKDSTGNVITKTGKGVIIWKKQSDGVWKVALEIWNSNSAETK